MTMLTKVVRRELPLEFDRRAWISEWHPWGMRFRAKRTRKPFDITWNQVLNRAMEIEAAAEKAAKRRKP